ncbi:MAG TPA: DUF58 domain-containing protein, partial [Methyloversatilis sp.]
MREALRRWLSTLGGSPEMPVILDRRRIFVLPTGAGIAWGCAVLAMLLTAINYTLSLGFALVFMLAGLGQVALLHTFRNLLGLRLQEMPPEPVFAGHQVGFPIRLDNASSRPRRALRLAMPGGNAVQFDLDAGQSRTVTLQLPSHRRGWMTPGRLTLTTRYPLGLIRAWSYAQPLRRCLVHARPEAERPPLPLTGSGDGVRHASDEGSDEFACLRTHRAADSPRHVAWKAWARTPDAPLLSKQFEGGDGGDLWLDLA